MLKLDNVSVSYGQQTVLTGVCAAFEKGSLTGVIGVNGCGKSTLLKAVVGVLPLAEGKITLDGERLDYSKRKPIAQKIAYLAQGKNTPNMTVEQLVLHGRFPYLSYPRRYGARDREIARQAMSAVGISHLATKPLHALSGGMRQNAYFAMALAQDTDYILLDEPTTYLDVTHQLTLLKTLRKLADDGKGIVAVMHDLPMAFTFCNQILVVADGKIAACATPTQLCNSPLIKRLFGVTVQPTNHHSFVYHYHDE